MRKEWVVSIRNQCRAARVPFFFKQWGGVRKVRNGRPLDGRTYDEYPARRVVKVPDKATRITFAESLKEVFSNLLRPKDLVQLTTKTRYSAIPTACPSPTSL
jgi:hypothetical protein